MLGEPGENAVFLAADESIPDRYPDKCRHDALGNRVQDMQGIPVEIHNRCEHVVRAAVVHAPATVLFEYELAGLCNDQPVDLSVSPLPYRVQGIQQRLFREARFRERCGCPAVTRFCGNADFCDRWRRIWPRRSKIAVLTLPGFEVY